MRDYFANLRDAFIAFFSILSIDEIEKIKEVQSVFFQLVIFLLTCIYFSYKISNEKRKKNVGKFD